MIPALKANATEFCDIIKAFSVFCDKQTSEFHGTKVPYELQLVGSEEGSSLVVHT